MRQQGRLIYGLPYNGTDHYKFTISALTLGAELRAFDEIEEIAANGNINEAKKTLLETLAFWVQQIEVDGIPADKMTAEFLLEKLASEDYQTVLSALESLHQKSVAAGQLSE